LGIVQVVGAAVALTVVDVIAGVDDS
jgi:hypothetical protein